MASLPLAPVLSNQYTDDRVLRSYLKRTLPKDVFQKIEKDLHAMGALAGEALYTLQQADRPYAPVLTQGNPWDAHLDHIALTPLWQEAEIIAATHGLVATAYEQTHGAHARIHQFALAHLLTPSTDLYSVSLALTDGATSALLASGNNAILLDALPHLTTRNPDYFWTSSLWITDLPGHNDTQPDETMAHRDKTGTWRLFGRKGFVACMHAPMALVLARPEGNPPGNKGLALFYVEPRDEHGKLRNLRVDRLQDMMGSRKVPMTEITLMGTPSEPVQGLKNGLRTLAPLVQVVRTWHTATAVSLMRRGLALARIYASKPNADRRALNDPLSVDILACLQATSEGAFHLAFRIIELLGEVEAVGFTSQRTKQDPLLQVLTPLARLTATQQALAVLQDVMALFGGRGYREDTGLPALLREAMTLSHLEDTTNTLALAVLHQLVEADGLGVLDAEIQRCAAVVQEPGLASAVAQAQRLLETASIWIEVQQDRTVIEAGARRLAMSLGQALELALLACHAQWSLTQEQDARPMAAVQRLASGIAPTIAFPPEASQALAKDTSLTVAAFDLNEVTLPEVEALSGWGDGAG